MVLDIIVKKTDDGFTAEIPGLRGCESWAHDEDTVMEKITDLAAYYLKIESKDKFKSTEPVPVKIKSSINWYLLKAVCENRQDRKKIT